MKRVIGILSIWLAAFIMLAVSYDPGQSYCVIFPQNGRDIFGVSQRAIIIFGENEVSLIPQIHFEGDAEDFGIIVPVPAEPKLTTVGANIFNEASFLTQPLVRQSSDGCGCEDNNMSGPVFLRDQFAEGAAVDASNGGVTVIFEDIVGMFQAVVLQAATVDDLTQWLTENDYRFDPGDREILSTYVAQNWFFVAMKLDPNQVPQQINQWWAATTSPARIRFAHSSDELAYPLKISAISTNEKAEVLVYTIGKNAMQFDGAKVEYANDLTENEIESISRNYPTLADFLTEGQFITKLRRTFAKSEMNNDMMIGTNQDRTEYREVRYANNSGVGVFGLLLLLFALLFNRKTSAEKTARTLQGLNLTKDFK